MSNALPVRKFDQFLLEKPIEFLGKVDAVFQHAAWVRSDRGPLVTLLDTSKDLVPCGVELPLRLVSPSVGDFVEIRDRQLWITGPHGKDRILQMEGNGVSLVLPKGSRELHFERIQKQLVKIYLPPRTKALMGVESLTSNGLNHELIVRAGSQMRLLATMLCRGVHGPKSFREVVNRLVGLGPGLTPTGDDILVATAATASFFASAGWLSSQSLNSFLEEMQALPPEATTVVGREMIAHAFRGAFPEALLRFVTALGSSLRHPELEARKLAFIGGHSGADQLAAVYYLVSELLKSYSVIGKLYNISSIEEKPAQATLGTFSVWRR